VHGFVPGKSPLSNARWHQRKEWVLKVDLADFFPSIHFGRVRGMFMAYPFGYPPDVATLLAQVCCHRNELPQGAPTSPIITNFICRRLDTELARAAQSERCHYTRYADDICISTDRRAFPPSLGSWSASGASQAGLLLVQIVQGNGFFVNPLKTRLLRRTQRQRVTGLIVNQKVNVSTDYVRSLRNLLYIWERYGAADAEQAFARSEVARNRPPGKGVPAFARVVRGRVQYVGSVKGWTNPAYRRLATALGSLDSTFQPRTLLTLRSPQTLRVYTEGASDPLHLVAALAYFQDRGEFTNLVLEIPTDADAGGDSKLLEKCLRLAHAKQDPPCVCVFDRDNQKILGQALGAGDSKDHGNGVVAVALAVPPWRHQEVCIELLYENSDLQRRDENGRRLYLTEEFDRRTGHHRSERVHVPYPGGKPLVSEDVYSLDDGGKSVGLSKLAFAQDVTSGKGAFASPINFEGFRKTFELIEGAIARIAGT
jgi:RNA-directed DNA polymerase